MDVRRDFGRHRSNGYASRILMELPTLSWAVDANVPKGETGSSFFDPRMFAQVASRRVLVLVTFFGIYRYTHITDIWSVGERYQLLAFIKIVSRYLNAMSCLHCPECHQSLSTMKAPSYNSVTNELANFVRRGLKSLG